MFYFYQKNFFFKVYLPNKTNNVFGNLFLKNESIIFLNNSWIFYKMKLFS